ncbi:unnamed protein product [Closterium sp. NIES-65]|nr:unnamed protein product [Closterium sp. NIES-65]
MSVCSPIRAASQLPAVRSLHGDALGQSLRSSNSVSLPIPKALPAGQILPGGSAPQKLQIQAKILKTKRAPRDPDYPWPDKYNAEEKGFLAFLSKFKDVAKPTKPMALPFEKPLVDLEKKIEEVRQLADKTGMDFTDQVQELQDKYEQLKRDIYARITPVQRLSVARHPNPPAPVSGAGRRPLGCDGPAVLTSTFRFLPLLALSLPVSLLSSHFSFRFPSSLRTLPFGFLPLRALSRLASSPRMSPPVRPRYPLPLWVELHGDGGGYDDPALLHLPFWVKLHGDRGGYDDPALWVELHGDRGGYDDPALVCGIGRMDGMSFMFMGHQKGRNTKENIYRNFGMPTPNGFMFMGHQKGRNTKENIYRNFGMPTPNGYRKALRMMRHADHHGLPIITFVDTPGAYAGVTAEELGQGEAIAHNLREMFGLEGEAIAHNLREMFGLKVPSVSVVIGEGGSGGALAIGCCNKMLMLENAVYFVASPEACAAILWKTAAAAPKATEALRITADQLQQLGVVDEIIQEPLGGAHNDHMATSMAIKASIMAHMKVGGGRREREMLDLVQKDEQRIICERVNKFRQMGGFTVPPKVDPAKQRALKKRDRPAGQSIPASPSRSASLPATGSQPLAAPTENGNGATYPSSVVSADANVTEQRGTKQASSEETHKERREHGSKQQEKEHQEREQQDGKQQNEAQQKNQTTGSDRRVDNFEEGVIRREGKRQEMEGEEAEVREGEEELTGAASRRTRLYAVRWDRQPANECVTGGECSQDVGVFVSASGRLMQWDVAPATIAQQRVHAVNNNPTAPHHTPTSSHQDLSAPQLSPTAHASTSSRHPTSADACLPLLPSLPRWVTITSVSVGLQHCLALSGEFSGTFCAVLCAAAIPSPPCFPMGTPSRRSLLASAIAWRSQVVFQVPACYAVCSCHAIPSSPRFPTGSASLTSLLASAIASPSQVIDQVSLVLCAAILFPPPALDLLILSLRLSACLQALEWCGRGARGVRGVRGSRKLKSNPHTQNSSLPPAPSTLYPSSTAGSGMVWAWGEGGEGQLGVQIRPHALLLSHRFPPPLLSLPTAGSGMVWASSPFPSHSPCPSPSPSPFPSPHSASSPSHSPSPPSPPIPPFHLPLLPHVSPLSCAMPEDGSLFSFGWGQYGQVCKYAVHCWFCRLLCRGQVAIAAGLWHSLAPTHLVTSLTAAAAAAAAGAADATGGKSGAAAVFFMLAMSHSLSPLFTPYYPHQPPLVPSCGHGTSSDHLSPTRISSFSGLTVTAIAAGLWHSLALALPAGSICGRGAATGGDVSGGDADVEVDGADVELEGGDVYSWGGNQFGQLGTGDTAAKVFPTLLDSPDLDNCSLKGISCGARHSAAITTNGTLFVWGSNKFGQDQLLICRDVRLEPGRQLGAYQLPDADVDSSINDTAGAVDTSRSASHGHSRPVFLFNKMRLLPKSPPPAVEEIEEISVPELIITVGEPGGEPLHPLDRSGNPLLRAIPSYERQFRQDLLQAQAYLAASQSRFDTCRRLLQEQHTQAEAVRSGSASMEAMALHIVTSFADFQSSYKQQYSRHELLLRTFHRNLRALHSCRLLAPVRAATGWQSLVQLAKEPRLQQAFSECHVAHAQMATKVAELEQQFQDTRAGIEELIGGGGGGSGETAVSGPSADAAAGAAGANAGAEGRRREAEVVREVEGMVEEGHRLLEEQEVILGVLGYYTTERSHAPHFIPPCLSPSPPIRSSPSPFPRPLPSPPPPSKDLNTVRQLLHDCTVSVTHSSSSSSPSFSPSASPSRLLPPPSPSSSPSSSSSTSSSSSSPHLQPIEAVAALDPICTVHSSSLLPRISAIDSHLAALVQSARASKIAMTNLVHTRMQAVARWQSRVRGFRNRLHAFREAISRQDALFSLLASARALRGAYADCIGEIARRKGFGMGYMGRAQQVAEEMARVREEEVERRERFWQRQGELGLVPRVVIEGMGLGHGCVPSVCTVSVAPFDEGLVRANINSSIAHVYDEDDTAGSAFPSHHHHHHQQHRQQHHADVDEEDADVSQSNDDMAGGRSAEELAVDNMRLRAELIALRVLGAAGAGATGVGLSGVGEGACGGGGGGHVAEEWQQLVQALQLREQVVRHVQVALRDRQAQVEAYERRIRELEGMLGDMSRDISRDMGRDKADVRTSDAVTEEVEQEGGEHIEEGAMEEGRTVEKRVSQEGEREEEGKSEEERRREVAGLQEEVQATLSEVQSLQSKLTATESQLSAAQSNLSAGESNLATVQSKLTAAEARLAAAESQLAEARDESARLEGLLSERSAELDARTVDINNITVDFNACKEELSLCIVERERNQGRLEQLQRELDQVSQQQRHEAARVADLEADVAQKDAELAKLAADLAAAEVVAGRLAELEQRAGGPVQLQQLVVRRWGAVERCGVEGAAAGTWENKDGLTAGSEAGAGLGRQGSDVARHVEALEDSGATSAGQGSDVARQVAALEEALRRKTAMLAERGARQRTLRCAADRRAAESGGLRAAAVRLRGLMERINRCLQANSLGGVVEGLSGLADSLGEATGGVAPATGGAVAAVAAVAAASAGSASGLSRSAVLASGLSSSSMADSAAAAAGAAGAAAAAGGGGAAAAAPSAPAAPAAAAPSVPAAEEWVVAAVRAIALGVGRVVERGRRAEGDAHRLARQLQRTSDALVDMSSKHELVKQIARERTAFARFHTPDIAAFVPVGRGGATTARSARLSCTSPTFSVPCLSPSLPPSLPSDRA